MDDKWQPIEDAPRNGEQFLAGLSNGWVVILSEPHNPGRYAWYRSAPGINVPIERTHGGVRGEDTLYAEVYQPLPDYTPKRSQ